MPQQTVEMNSSHWFSMYFNTRQYQTKGLFDLSLTGLLGHSQKGKRFREEREASSGFATCWVEGGVGRLPVTRRRPPSALSVGVVINAPLWQIEQLPKQEEVAMSFDRSIVVSSRFVHRIYLASCTGHWKSFFNLLHEQFIKLLSITTFVSRFVSYFLPTTYTLILLQNMLLKIVRHKKKHGPDPAISLGGRGQRDLIAGCIVTLIASGER